MTRPTITKVPRRLYPELRALLDRLLTADGDESVWQAQGEYWAAWSPTGAAVAVAGLVRSTRFTDVVYLHAVGVDEAYRGHHMQRRLIRARVRWARAHGFSHAVTYTLVDNVASSRSLVACGFKPYWPSYPWAGRFVCYWLRAL